MTRTQPILTLRESRHYIVATAGHVDHGKSALVKALTGVDPDRLPEEKARGITIDLGFAHLELPVPTGGAGTEEGTFSIGIVDVPGHEDFVKNMVAGVGSIDVALFVVAADDGWMPQTEEHLQILHYLGVNRAVVALTKIDLLGSESARRDAFDQIRQRVAESPFAQAPIIGTSAVRGEGIGELKAALANVLADTPAPRDIGKPRLPVDRVFTLRGIGTVVTGTLNGGALRRGQPVVVQPSGRATRVRTVQSHNQDVEVSLPGTRTALGLPDVPKYSDQETTGIQRGDVVTLAELGGPSDALDVVLEKSARLADSKSSAARPLKSGALVRIHHGSGHFTARVLLSGSDELTPGKSALAQLRAETPVFAFAGDRFIVRDWAEQVTLGGGYVLDPDARRKHFRSETHQRYLAERAAAPERAAAFVRSQLARDGAMRRGKLLLKSRFSASEVEQAVREVQAEVVSAGDWLVHTPVWQKLRAAAMEAIDTEHRVRPQHMGLALSELRRSIEPLLPSAELFDPLVADLGRTGFIQSGVAIRRGTHRPALPPQLQSAGAKLRATLSTKPFEPPSRKELTPDAKAQQALRFFIETGEAIEVGEEVVLLSDAYQQAVETVKRFLKERQRATVSELRQAIGASRRIVVPLLEKLDREGVTRREGDVRVLR